MPTLEDVQSLHKRATARAFDLIAKKGRDYNRDKQLTGDTLYNLRLAAILGIVDTPVRSVLVRLSDKFQRLISLSTVMTGDIENENLLDTIVDIINYAVYVYAFWQEGQEDKKA